MANNQKPFTASRMGVPFAGAMLYDDEQRQKAKEMAEHGNYINNREAIDTSKAANAGALYKATGMPHDIIPDGIDDTEIPMERLGTRKEELQKLHDDMLDESRNVEPGEDPLTDASVKAITGRKEVNKQKITNIQTKMHAINEDLKFEEQGEQQEAEYKGDWENDSHVWGGTQRFFTSLLKTGNIGQAFQDAGQYYDEEVDADERSKYAVEMEDDYTPASIAEWVKSGNEGELVTHASLQQGHLNNEAKKAEIISTKQKNALDSRFAIGDRDLAQKYKEASINSLNASTISSEYSLQQKQMAKVAEGQKAKNEYQGKASMSAIGAEMGLKTWNAYNDELRAKGETYALKDSGSFTTQAAINNYFERDPGMKNALIASMSKATYKAIHSEQMFLKSVLRLESGAAIGEAEWKQYGNIFFPRQDDTPAKEARKALARNVTAASMAQLGIMTKGKEGDMQREAAMGNIVKNLRDVAVFNSRMRAYKTHDGKWHSIKALALY